MMTDELVEYVIDRVAECMIGFSCILFIFAVLTEVNAHLSGVGI